MRGVLSPREIDRHTAKQVAILLDYDVDPQAQPVPTRYDRARDARTANVGRPGFCEHGNSAPECRQCRTARATAAPDPDPDVPRTRLRRVV